MKSFLVKTFTTGIALFIPFFFVVFILIRSVGFMRETVKPLVEKLPVEGLLGFIVLDLIAILIVAFAIFLLGLTARMRWFADRVDKLDSLLTNRVPGYSIFKGIIHGAVGEDTSVSGLKSVLVRYNGTGRIGFEVERTQSGEVIVFLPNVPNPQSGTAAAFRAEDVEPLDIPPHKLIETLNFHGKGIGKDVAAIRQKRSTAG